MKLAVILTVLCVVTRAPIAAAQQSEKALISAPSQANNHEVVTTGSLPNPLPAFVSPEALTRPWAADSLREELLQDVETGSLEKSSASGYNLPSPEIIAKAIPKPKRKNKLAVRRRTDQPQSAEYKWDLKIFGSSE